MGGIKKTLFFSHLFLPTFLALYFVFFVFFSGIVYLNIRGVFIEHFEEHANTYAKNIARQIDTDKLLLFTQPEQENARAYTAFRMNLIDKASGFPFLDSVSLLRKTSTTEALSYIVDTAPKDYHHLGELLYIKDQPSLLYLFNGQIADFDRITTPTSTQIIGYAPLTDRTNNVVAILAVKISMENVSDITKTIRFNMLAIIFVMVTFMLLIGLAISRLSKRRYLKTQERLTELDAIINYAPIGIYTILPNGNISSFNPKMVELAGTSKASDAVGLNVFKMDSYKKVGLDKYFRMGLKGKEFTVETPYSSTLGSKKTYRKYYGTPIYSENKKNVISLLLLVQDITDQKELEQKISQYTKELQSKITERTAVLEEKVFELKNTEKAMINILADSKETAEELKEERDRATAIVSSMSEGLILADAQNNIVLINHTGGALLRLTPSDVVGKNICDIIHLYKKDDGEIDFKNILKSVVDEGDIQRFTMIDQVVASSASGRRKFPIALAISPFHSDGINGSVLVFQDITKEKELDEAKGSFITTASHQLRTPLTSIRWYAELLTAGKMSNFSEKEKRYATNIHDGAVRLNETINLLLSLSRVESGKIESSPEIIDCKEIMKTIISDTSSQIEKKAVHIKIEAEKDCPDFMCNAFQLKQVMTNLVSNAVRYSHAGGEVIIKIYKQKSDIHISVQDDGIGIPKNEQNSIFNKFFRASNAVRTVPDGSGLGLALVKAIVESWHGKISFSSKENGGSKFDFTIPLVS